MQVIGTWDLLQSCLDSLLGSCVKKSLEHHSSEINLVKYLVVWTDYFLDNIENGT